MPDHAHWTESLRTVLAQGRDLAAALDPADFTRPIEPWRSGIGGHLRHVADFVRSFVDDLPEGRIDYDARRRDERLEREPARAVLAFEALIAELQALALADAGALERPLLVRSEAPSGADPHEHWLTSTVGRELAALLSHTVHHYALIALALRQLGHEPPAEFGVAPSTLAYQRARSA